MKDTLKPFINKIEKLPTLPVIAREILSLDKDPLLSIDKLTSIVERDPAISAKIISTANSPFFASLNHPANLNDAIMRIGFNTVKSIAVGISILSFMNDSKKTTEYTRIFNHSLTVGLTARLIAKDLHTGNEEDILVEGLLHDLGYLVLNRYLPDMYQSILNVCNDEMSILDAEKNILNTTHAEIGFWLALRWNLPETISDTILYHHTPSLGKNPTHKAIIHLADYLAAKNICSPFEKNPNYPLDQSSFDILSITDNDLKDMEELICTVPLTDETFKMENESTGTVKG
jgi:putative nucleotidyltransferase with HDIG domain